MKTLPETFSANGYTFRTLERDRMVALLEKTKPGSTWTGYEVVVIQSHNGREICGIQYPPAEYMPPPKMLGEAVWTYMGCDLGGAHAKYEEMRAAQDRPGSNGVTTANAFSGSGRVNTADGGSDAS